MMQDDGVHSSLHFGTPTFGVGCVGQDKVEWLVLADQYLVDVLHGRNIIIHRSMFVSQCIQ